MKYSLAQADLEVQRETIHQRVADLCERLDRLYIGDEAYDHYLSVTAEVDREEELRRMERLQEIRAISERNRRFGK